jgi:hypothetical protein
VLLCPAISGCVDTPPGFNHVSRGPARIQRPTPCILEAFGLSLTVFSVR